MMYYSADGVKKIFTLDKQLFYGGCSGIYALDDKLCLKKYFSYTSDKCRLDYNTYKLLKEINSPNTNNIHDLYYEKHLIEDVDFLISNPNNFQTDAYSFEFLEDDNKNIMECSTEYLLENMVALEQLIKILTDYKVFMRDLKRSNTVYNGDNIVLIDPDCYKVNNKDSYRYILKNNNCQLKNLFIDLFKNCNSYEEKYKCKVEELFSPSRKPNLSETVAKKLVKYKMPIDYIKDRGR